MQMDFEEDPPPDIAVEINVRHNSHDGSVDLV